MNPARNQTEKAVAFVVVRLSSSRLPAKQLRRIGDRPLLEWTLEGLRRCTELDEIVLTTVAEPANEPLRAFAAERGLPLFWYQGEVDHVTTRLRRAAEAHGADICVLVSGDCPLIPSTALDRLVRALRHTPEAQRVAPALSPAGHPPLLEGVSSIARTEAWRLGDDLSDTAELKEHQFPVFGMHPELFPAIETPIPEAFCTPCHRYSVDTMADLAFMNAVHDELACRGLPFCYAEALPLLRERPDLMRINAHVHQRQLGEELGKVLFVADAGGEFGFGHLMRCVELARQTVERLGWSAEFLLEDEQARAVAEREGFRMHRGHPGNTESLFASSTNGVTHLVLDLHPDHRPASGWRTRWAGNRPTLVLDQLEPWTDEADLIVVPGVTAAPDQLAERAPSLPPVLTGRDWVILRDEVRAAGRERTPKNIDLLAYLHRPDQRRAAIACAEKLGLRHRIVERFGPEFPDLLAASHVFLSGFGYSFYEALHLGARPVAWPFSESHEQDALHFYRAFAMEPAVVSGPEDLPGTLQSALGDPPIPEGMLGDGTPSIVNRLAGLGAATGRETPR